MIKPADRIKIKLTEYIINNKFENYTSSSLLMEEMPFLDKTRFSDLSLIHDKMIAFEIKSHADSLIKLESQINDYIKVFDKLYIVVDSKFQFKLKSIDNKIGIFIYNKETNQLNKIRNAKSLSKEIKKEDLSLLISKKYYNFNNKNKFNLDEIRSHEVKKKSKSELKELIIDSIYLKYKNPEYNLANSFF